jgi:oxalate decarboxylase/phosphoglucose isomerase-like protein (cupin superfamily)
MLGGGRGGNGKIITAEFSNVGGASIAMRVRAGDQVGVNGGDGHTIGNAGYAVLYIEP